MFGPYVTKKLISFVGVFCLCSGVLLPRIDMVNYKGTWDVVKKDYKDFSPFRGMIAVESGLAEKMHTFGKITTKKETSQRGLETEYVVAGDATIKLSWCLFKTEGGQFSQRSGSTHIAGYLTPPPIGQMLQEIKENPKKTEQDAEKLEAALKSIMWRAVINSSTSFIVIEEWLKKIRGLITQDLPAITNWFKQFYKGSIDPFGLMVDPASSATSSRLTELLLWGQKEMVRQQKLAKTEGTLKEFGRKEANIYDFAHFAASVPPQLRSKIKKAHEYWSSIQKEVASKNFQDQFEATKKNFSRKKRAFLGADIGTCAKLIVQALTESGYFQDENKQPKRLYDSHTVYQILLSLLYLTIKEPSDLKTYFDQFSPSILAKEYEAQNFDCAKVKEKALKLFTESQEDDDEDVDEATKDADTSLLLKDFVKNNFEEACLLGFLQQGSGLPPMVKTEAFMDCQPSPGMCVEATFLNFVRILLAVLGFYDQAHTVFNIGNIEEVLKQRIKEKNLKTMVLGSCKLKEFFEKYILNGNAYITQGEAFQGWLRLVSDCSGLKYLSKYNKQKNPMTRIEKTPSYERPFIHDSGEKNVYNEYGNSIAIPCSSEVFLVELVGCPSNYVNIVNYLFGLQLKNFRELCSFFDLKIEDDIEISDRVLYGEEISLEEVFLRCRINEKDYRLKLETSMGHAEIHVLDSGNGSDVFNKFAVAIRNLIVEQAKTTIDLADLYYALSCYRPFCGKMTYADFKALKMLAFDKLFFLGDLLSQNSDELKESIVFAVASDRADLVGFNRLIEQFIEKSKDRIKSGDIDCIAKTVDEMMMHATKIRPSIMNGVYCLCERLTSRKGANLRAVCFDVLNFLHKHYVDEFDVCKDIYGKFQDWAFGDLRDYVGSVEFDKIIDINFLGQNTQLFSHDLAIKPFLKRIKDVILTKSKVGNGYKLCSTLLRIPDSAIERNDKIEHMKKLLPLINEWDVVAPDVFKLVIDNDIKDLIPSTCETLTRTFVQHEESDSFIKLLVEDGETVLKKKCELTKLFEYVVVKSENKLYVGENEQNMFKKMAIRYITLYLICYDSEKSVGSGTKKSLINICDCAKIIRAKPFNMSSKDILILVAKDIKEYCIAGIKSLDDNSKVVLRDKWKESHGLHSYKLNEFAKCAASDLNDNKKKQWARAALKSINVLIKTLKNPSFWGKLLEKLKHKKK